jgi:hypothetical protein
MKGRRGEEKEGRRIRGEGNEVRINRQADREGDRKMK